LPKPVQLLKRIEMDDPKIDKDGKTVTLAFKDLAGDKKAASPGR